MNPPPFRRGHRKRLSVLRLSSDSNATLPVYTSPPWQRTVDLPIDISDRPPDYPDSSEEGDADIDSDDADDRAVKPPYTSPTPPLSYSPRRSSNSSNSRLSRRSSARSRPQPSSNDPYLDALLARSVHALELSNTLLQSSMSTQSSLSTVLADTTADTTLDSHAHSLSARIGSNHTAQNSILDDLKEIENGVEDLFGDEDPGGSISRSLPTSTSGQSLSARVQASSLRRPSLDFRTRERSLTESQLQLSNHNRRDLIAPAPRAMTMYVDSTTDPFEITLPPTLGLRSSTNLPPTPLPSERSFHSQDASPSRPPAPEQPKRAVDVLSSYIVRKPPTRRSSTSTISTVVSSLKRRRSKSPPPPIRTSPSVRGRSVTPARDSGSPSQRTRPLIPIPSIEELSASSDSSSSDTMHVDRTLESLRTILEKQPPPPSIPQRSPVRPTLLSPPTVAPISGTSTATASVSRLFTKGRHSSSTRPPSPPRQSALKNRSEPSTPRHTPSPSLSMLSVSDALISPFGFGSHSGGSTPKRISFAELPASTRAQSARTVKPRSHSSSKRKGKRKAGDAVGAGVMDGDSSGGENGWWTTWLMGAAGTSASGVGMGATRRGDERLVRSSTWSTRPGFGSSLEDWAM